LFTSFLTQSIRASLLAGALTAGILFGLGQATAARAASDWPPGPTVAASDYPPGPSVTASDFSPGPSVAASAIGPDF
jgi:hypothetical protein